MKRSGARNGGPHPLDAHVGSRLRMRRTMLGLSQQMLAEALGLTFQQVQKYERGSNCISASRLLQISRILGVPIKFFYDATDPVHAPPMLLDEISGPECTIDPFQQLETIDLVRAYYDIPDPIRRRLFALVRSLSLVPERESGYRRRVA